VSGFAPRIATMSDHTTSCITGQMMAGRSGRSIFWTNTAKNVPSRQHGFAMRLPGSGTIRVKRKLNSTEVIDALTDLFILRGVPAYIRSGNGPEFIAEAVRDWIKAVGAKTAYIEPRSPLSGHRHAMPCRAVHGRTDPARVSTGGCATSC